MKTLKTIDLKTINGGAYPRAVEDPNFEYDECECLEEFANGFWKGFFGVFGL